MPKPLLHDMFSFATNNNYAEKATKPLNSHLRNNFQVKISGSLKRIIP